MKELTNKGLNLNYLDLNCSADFFSRIKFRKKSKKRSNALKLRFGQRQLKNRKNCKIWACRKIDFGSAISQIFSASKIQIKFLSFFCLLNSVSDVNGPEYSVEANF